MSTIATTAQTADSMDYWVRRHLFNYRYGAHPCQSEGKRKPPWDRRIIITFPIFMACPPIRFSYY